MKRKPSSLRDIARKLNVSVTTVSFVLNGKAKEMRISEKVTEKILDYAKEVNYTPNQLAQSLRTGKSKIIVFMVEDISNPFFAKLARIIEVAAYKNDYKVIFCSNENSDNRTRELIKVFKDRKVDGYIIIPSIGAKPYIQTLVDENIPVVLFDRYLPDLETNYVIIDNEEATYKATQHLFANGFSNVGLITINTKQTQMIARLKGYREAVAQANLNSAILELPLKRDFSFDKKILLNFLKKQGLDAVFFTTNYLTQKGMMVMKENFPNYSDKFGIMAFDDNEFFQIHTPSISAVAQPLQRIGESLMKIILHLLQNEDKKIPLQQMILSTEFQERESSKRNKPESGTDLVEP